MAVRADNSFEFHTPPRDETKREKRLRIVASLLSVFNTMTVRDGIDPHRAHHAMLAIDEYAEVISPDMPGARSRSKVT
jgi:hypothetical protein